MLYANYGFIVGISKVSATNINLINAIVSTNTNRPICNTYNEDKKD
jgi:hypothetical protein